MIVLQRGYGAAKYITTYFSQFLTDKERLEVYQLRIKYRAEHAYHKENIDQRIQAYRRIGWLINDEEASRLALANEDELDKKMAERILAEHKDKVFINRCPKCNQLARTPSARQCRHCGFRWR